MKEGADRENLAAVAQKETDTKKDVDRSKDVEVRNRLRTMDGPVSQVPDEQIKADVEFINKKLRTAYQSAFKTMLAIGERLLQSGYGGERTLYESRRPNKQWSLDKLVKAGAHLKASQLRNAINLFLDVDKLPSEARQLQPTHAVLLLGAPEEERDVLTKRALEKGLSTRALRAQIKAASSDIEGTDGKEQPEDLDEPGDIVTDIEDEDDQSSEPAVIEEEGSGGAPDVPTPATPVDLIRRIQVFRQEIEAAAPIPSSMTIHPKDATENDFKRLEEGVFAAEWDSETAVELVDELNSLFRLLEWIRQFANDKDLRPGPGMA